MPLMPKQAEALTSKARRRCRRKGGIPQKKGECHCAVGCNSDFSQFHCQSATDCICLKKASGGGFCGFVGPTEGLQGNPCDENNAGCTASTVCVVRSGCPGSGNPCSSKTDCPAPMGCVKGRCQVTSCVPPCSCLRQGSPCDVNNAGACCSGACSPTSGCL